MDQPVSAAVFRRCTWIVPWLAVAGLFAALWGCVTVEGSSTGDLKEQLTSSYLYRSVKRFYPEGAPADPATVYPTLDGQQLREIESELQAMSSLLVQRHQERRAVLEFVLKRPVAAASAPRFVVERTLRPTAFSSQEGRITVDVRVLQAVFRGALLSAGGATDDSFGTNAASADGFKVVDPEQQTQRQRELIQAAVELTREIDRIPAKTMLGDVAGMLGRDSLDAPWFRMSELTLRSQRLQWTYAGAALFLMAHEMGHLALGHHAMLARLQSETADAGRTDNSAYCQQRRDLEHEADAYALVLLTRGLGDTAAAAALPIDMFGLDAITGFDSFFRYGYPLAGFDGGGGQCAYPTAFERHAFVQEGEDTFRELARRAMAESLDRAIDEKLQSPDGGARR